MIKVITFALLSVLLNLISLGVTLLVNPDAAPWIKNNFAILCVCVYAAIFTIWSITEGKE